MFVTNSGVQMVLVNKDELFKQLDDIPRDKARKAFNATMKEIGKSAPSWIGQIGARRYNIAATKLNPNTKAGSGKGSVGSSSSVSGEVASITFTYKGRRLTIGGSKGQATAAFSITPNGRRQRAYTTTVHVLRGKKSKAGYWKRPWSEKGARGARSPWFVPGGMAGGIGLMRVGSGFGDPLRGPSVPQMVVNPHTENELRDKLETEAMKVLKRKIDWVL